ncbi:hypothetical protein CCMA1212_009334 [Trichoderma ghanense]|uniref:Uncharacterized protein n=1 Tax=Trichoderma ghanense TaxID=65468 RepID=A0ABY2GTI9_9HYPO
MSLPSFILTPAAHSEALEPAFKARKLTHGWVATTSITADPVLSHADKQSNTIQNTFLPLQAADYKMLQQTSPGSCIEPQRMDFAAPAEGYLFPVTPQGETASLDAWLHVPDCQPESSIYQTVPAHQDLNVFQPLWSAEEVAFEASNLETFSAISYPQAPISGDMEPLKQDIEQYQLPSDAIPPHESILQPKTDVPAHSEPKAKNKVAQGQVVDQVLGALRQMDCDIRAYNRQHMADIAGSLLL